VRRKPRTRRPPPIPLVREGAIVHPADAATKQAAGAILVQTYTGLIYRGPRLIGECVDALRRRKEAPSRGTLPPE
jgi:dihydroorotate dehydrogenase